MTTLELSEHTTTTRTLSVHVLQPPQYHTAIHSSTPTCTRSFRLRPHPQVSITNYMGRLTGTVFTSFTSHIGGNPVRSKILIFHRVLIYFRANVLLYASKPVIFYSVKQDFLFSPCLFQVHSLPERFSCFQVA